MRAVESLNETQISLDDWQLESFQTQRIPRETKAHSVIHHPTIRQAAILSQSPPRTKPEPIASHNPLFQLSS